ncbi:DUF2029 domain-containing protein [Microbacterium sp. AG1240]|uniref:DUF2029 domain-containing protein n=1 Tax=Microbacterium sp. AG1240 TaxID=2183992 RepID=UPI001C7D5ED5|nr:DUF2029 domain-containing protein [Microbacterium sp. AG1240]
MSRELRNIWLWFLGAHALVVALGFLLWSQPMGDVYNVYEPWSNQALGGGGIVGITEQWVYPQVALVPMLAAHLFSWMAGYTFGWAVLVCVLDAAAFAFLVGRGRSRARMTGARVWLVLFVLLGPIGMYRIDAITVPLAIVALLLAIRHPAVSSAILTIGAWIKIWPAAVVLALTIAARKRWWVVVASAGATAAAVVLVVVALGGAGNLTGFITAQVGRGLQMESTAATPFVWLAVFGVNGAKVAFDDEIITFAVYGPGVDTMAALLTPLMAVAVAAVCVVGVLKARAGARMLRLLPPLTLTLVLVLIVFNKVGSPQFVAWIIAPFVLWAIVDRHGIRRGLQYAAITAFLTQGVYPLVFDLVRVANPIGVLVLTARNVMLVVLLVWVVRQLLRVPTERTRVAHIAASGPRRADAPTVLD